MHILIKKANEEVKKLEKALLRIDEFLEKAPGGCLKWQNKKGKIYYTHQFEEVKNGRKCS